MTKVERAKKDPIVEDQTEKKKDQIVKEYPLCFYRFFYRMIKVTIAYLYIRINKYVSPINKIFVIH